LVAFVDCFHGKKRSGLKRVVVSGQVPECSFYKGVFSSCSGRYSAEVFPDSNPSVTMVGSSGVVPLVWMDTFTACRMRRKTKNRSED
jgi:hypothetical protein